MTAESRLAELGIELPPAAKPMGVYKPIVIAGNMAYLSGHGPLKPDGKLITGRLGLDMDVEAGYEAARVTGAGDSGDVAIAPGQPGQGQAAGKTAGAGSLLGQLCRPARCDQRLQ